MREISLLFKAVSDRTRLRIILMLRDRSMCVCEIRQVLQLAISTVSKHLSILRNAGLIVDFKQGKWVNYRRQDQSDDPKVQKILQLVDMWLEQDQTVKKDRDQAARADRNDICS
jgi:ArsR family transcriptional regulator, arsenate/arsenite/antimonite-responsive transcriptional repressor